MTKIKVASFFSDTVYIRFPPGPLSGNNLQQVIYTRGPQANI